MAELWSDYTDALISDLDPDIKKKYGVALSELLSNPKDFADNENLSVTIGNIKEDVNSYIESQKQQALLREKNFNDMLERADSISQKISQRLSVTAKQNNVPLVKPVSIDRNSDNEEHIYVDSSDDSVIALAEKLAASSMMIADFTTEYNNFKIGEWYFSGHKNYTLSVYMPASNVMLLDTSKSELDTLLDAAAEFISG
ncbi:MAG: hypothetical protein M1360_00380 [Candidatus Marsarchaeota archaeon]|jgi:hypothetical protein|nr:hypothetical protein [Candidatus Marsarchaeota archaeon]MCL5418382.1 hypothetical protein [Candidatus Marsarchaeota archaeon]